jgi:hypothetical protein
MKNIDENISRLTGMLLDELEKSNIIKLLDKSKKGAEKRYHFTDLDKVITPGRTVTSIGIPGIIDNFYDFRNILSNVHRKIRALADNEGVNPTLNKVIDNFIKIGVINPAWKNARIIRELFDKADDVLTEDESRNKAIASLKRNKVSFNPLIIKVLEYYSKVILGEIFDDGYVTDPNVADEDRNSNTADFIVNVPEASPYIIVDVKFRKKKIVIKEIIEQAARAIKIYDNLQKDKTKCIIIVYTYENLGQVERDSFSFKESMERRLSLKDRMYYIPVPINSLENLGNHLQALREEILERTVVPFTFKTQPPTSDKPAIDDHFYPKMIDLRKNNIEIRIKPKMGGHWRFGLRFSIQPIPPSKDERHPVNFALVHLQKEANSHKISLTCYNEANEFTEIQTGIVDYRQEELVLQVYNWRDEKIVNVLNRSREGIIEKPIPIGHQDYCWIFAWADNKNPFEFDAEIIEYARQSVDNIDSFTK